MNFANQNALQACVALPVKPAGNPSKHSPTLLENNSAR
jgi:hypothetical protein